MAKKVVTLHPVDKLVADLKSWGVAANGYRFSQGIPLLLVKSRRTGYMVWVALHLNAADEWSREMVVTFIHTNYGAMIGSSLEDIQHKLKKRVFLEDEHRQRLADLLTARPNQPMFTQAEILETLG